MPKSDLPFGSEFTPTNMSLPRLLTLAHEHSGDRSAFQDAVRREYFDARDISQRNKHKLAGNTCIAMAAYGIIEPSAQLTEFGESLHDLREDELALYRALARHILLDLNGMNLILDNRGNVFTGFGRLAPEVHLSVGRIEKALWKQIRDNCNAFSRLFGNALQSPPKNLVIQIKIEEQKKKD